MYNPQVPAPSRPDMTFARTTSVRTSANLVRFAFGLTLLTNALVVWAVTSQRSIAGRLLDGSGGFSLGDAETADRRAHAMWMLSVVVLAFAAITFVVWFWRIRRNAGLFDPDGQRRAQPWAFWGRVCPVISLWVPLQIARDASRSTSADGNGAGGLLGAWWACYLVDLALIQVITRQHPTTLHAFASHATVEIVGEVVQAVAAVLAIMVVRRLSRDNDLRRESLLARSVRLG